MVFAGVDGLQVLRRMQNRSGTIQRDFLERSRVLNQIRSDVYLSGTYALPARLSPRLPLSVNSRTGIPVRPSGKWPSVL